MSTQFAPVWNNASVDLTCIRANVTNTNSGSGSTLLDLLVDGSSRVAIRKDGRITINQTQSSGSRIAYYSGGINLNNWGGGTMDFYFGSDPSDSTMAFSIRSSGAGAGVGIKKDVPLTWGDLSSAPDGRLVLIPDADNILAQRRTTNAQTFRLYKTWANNGVDYERAVLDWQTTADVLRIGTEAGGTGTVRNIALVGGNVGIGTTGPVPKIDVVTGIGNGTQNETNCFRIRHADVSGNAMSLQLGVNNSGGGSGGGSYNQGYAYLQSVYWGGNRNTIALNPQGGGVAIGQSFAYGCALDVSGDIGAKKSGTNAQLARVGFTAPGYGTFPAFIGGFADNGAWYSGIALTFNTYRGVDVSGVDGVERMRISSDGFVGIGLTSPAAKLDISDTTGAGSGSLAASALNIAQTWNTTGTPTAFKLNVTDTASNAASLLMDLQVGGSSKFKVDKSGNTTSASLTYSSEFRAIGSNVGYSSEYKETGTQLRAAATLSWSNGFRGFDTADIILQRDAAGILAQRRANTAGPTTYPQAFRLYNSVDGTDAAPGSNWERAKIAWESNVLKIGTEGLGTGSARALELINATIDSSGNSNLIFSGTGTIGRGFQLAGESSKNWSVFVGGSVVNANYQYGFALFESASSGYRLVVQKDNGPIYLGTSRVQIGGTTSSFPAIKRNSAALNFRLADDSADCDITAAHGTFSAGTDTVSNPILNLTQTWNNNATTFTGLLANFTDTQSASGSLLMDLQVGGSSKFKVAKDGTVDTGWNGSQYLRLGGADYQVYEATNRRMLVGSNASGIVMYSTWGIGWSAGADVYSNRDLYILRDAANTLAQRNGATGQTFRIYNTYTDASNYERAKIAWSSNVLQIGTEKLGTGSARALELQTDGTTRLTIGTDGYCGIGTTSPAHPLEIEMSSDKRLKINQTGQFNTGIEIGRNDQVNNTSWQLYNPSGSTDLRFYNGGERLTLQSSGNVGIGTASPSTLLHVAGATTLGGNVTISTFNIVTDTTTGTKIGTATNQKLGFWNATPDVQPTTAVAAATLVANGGNTITDTDTFDGYTLKQIVKALRNIGILA